MNFDKWVNNTTWKKIILMILGTMLLMEIVREILFYTLFHDVFTTVNHVITSEEVNMENSKKIADTHSNEITKKFDQAFSNADDVIESSHEKIRNLMN